MPHPESEKSKLLNRLRRIRGQTEAIERAVDEGSECSKVLHQATACRGALDGFIAKVIEDHARGYMLDPDAPWNDPRTKAAEDRIAAVHACLT